MASTSSMTNTKIKEIKAQINGAIADILERNDVPENTAYNATLSWEENGIGDYTSFTCIVGHPTKPCPADKVNKISYRSLIKGLIKTAEDNVKAFDIHKKDFTT